MRSGSRHASQVVDGFGHLLVDLGIATAHGEALCAWTFHADAHDGGDAWTGLCAMDGNVDGKIETHVEAQRAAGAYKLEHSLPVLDIKPSILATCMREI
ncbi:hypothetical protein D3C76_1705690 [compost metagenome]